MRLTDRPKKKRIVILVLSLLCLLALTGISLGAYTRQASLRGVVRNRDSQAIRFSSNYLQACNASENDSSKYAGKNVLFNESDTTTALLPINITISNYASGNSSAVNENDITYTLTFTISDVTDFANYSVDVQTGLPNQQTTTTYKPDSNGIIKIENVKMQGRTAVTNEYVLNIPGADLNKVSIIAVADPNPLSATNQQKLAAVLVPGTQASVPTFQCTGTFIDATSANSPKDYDAFNYEVAITSGRAKVQLSWDSSLVELDQYFLTKLDARARGDSTYYLTSGGTDQKSYEITQDTTDTNKKTITFIMNQNKGTGDYLIPFYIVNKTEIDKKSWDDMKGTTDKKGIISVSGEALTE